MIYNLPDISLLESNAVFDYLVWQPDRVFVVLGSSDDIENSVRVENLTEDIVVLKRPSGGHSVVLSPKTIAIAMIFANRKQKPSDIFAIANGLIIEALRELDIRDLQMKGISDVCIGNKKILGSSMYKKPDKYFYHAVLNVDEDISLIENLLKHPRREPDYRKGRSHKDFVTSIGLEGYNLSVKEIIDKLEMKFRAYKANL